MQGSGHFGVPVFHHTLPAVTCGPAPGLGPARLSSRPRPGPARPGSAPGFGPSAPDTAVVRPCLLPGACMMPLRSTAASGAAALRLRERWQKCQWSMVPWHCAGGCTSYAIQDIKCRGADASALRCRGVFCEHGRPLASARALSAAVIMAVVL